ncbi:MAG: tRNA (adenosine(37)-N6)-threonylcarbamoyltransferase complex dimerization subunit type 1 TsaB [Oscillospiraceae bacterium]|jgi:tRNA threonylcarbamoyladenosine biosynthesis protein TsaB|nr:tRNA (adenosine(37)-N6)-threonylcarbamoyltransferase complex dimerization subunit type 1 TsaB [Oscillospiraceae bacterium]
MIILAFESSAKAASVALTRNGALLAQYFQNSGLTHSRTLLKMAEDILKNNELSAADVGRVAVARGPGSFTGVRIGTASAKGFAWGADIPARAVSSLRAAASVFADFEGFVICPAMDARRGEVYNALFEASEGAIKRLAPDRALPADSVAEEAAASGKTYLLTGDGAGICAESFKERRAPYRLAPELLQLQCAYGVALAAEGAPDVSAAELSPDYLRVPQAERLLRQRQ